jgi:hypothetical protein
VLDQFKKSAAERRTPAATPPPAGPSVPALEKMLLNALITSEEARAEVLPLLPEPTIQTFSTREIFGALRNLAAAGTPVTFSALHGRLSEPAQGLLHEIVAADEMMDDARALEQARSCVRRLEADIRKRELDEMRSRVKTAEREGRVEEALGWIAEIERLRRAVEGANADPR